MKYLILLVALIPIFSNCQTVNDSNYSRRQLNNFYKYKTTFIGSYDGVSNDTIVNFFQSYGNRWTVSQCEFIKPCNFGSLRVSDYCSFVDSTIFRKKANFFYSNFDGFVMFGAHFMDTAEFGSSNFNQGVKFWDDRTFSSDFKGLVNFDFCTFSVFVSFERIKFEKKTSFYRAKFYATPNFEWTELPDSLDLSDLWLAEKLPDISFLHGSIRSLRNTTGKKCVLFAAGTDLSRIVLPSNLFTLGQSPYSSYDDIALQYEQIIKKCHEVGISDSEKGWTIDYKKFGNFHHYGIVGGWIINFLNEWFWNFGYNKERILFIWLPFCFLAFFIFNLINLKWIISKVYFDSELGKNFIGEHEKEFYLEKVTLDKSFKIKYAFFITSVIYFNLKINQEAINYQNTKGILYFYLLYATGTINVIFGIVGYIFKTT